MPTTYVISESGINWVWYWKVELNADETVTILKYFRLHNERDADEQVKWDDLAEKHSFPKKDYKVVESEGRIVTTLYGYKVTNPEYIFDYNEHYEDGFRSNKMVEKVLANPDEYGLALDKSV
jgi:hypothetical protein